MPPLSPPIDPHSGCHPPQAGTDADLVTSLAPVSAPMETLRELGGSPSRPLRLATSPGPSSSIGPSSRLPAGVTTHSSIARPPIPT